MLKEKHKNKPVRLDRKEPITLEYEKGTVISTGTLFISMLIILAFKIGTGSSSILWSCI